MLSYLIRVGDAFSSRYENEVDELREKFKRTKQGLMDSMNLEIWDRVLDTGERVIDVRERVVYTSERVKDIGERMVDTGERVIDIRESVVDTSERVIDTSGRVKDIGKRVVDAGEFAVFIIPLSIPTRARPRSEIKARERVEGALQLKRWLLERDPKGLAGRH